MERWRRRNRRETGEAQGMGGRGGALGPDLHSAGRDRGAASRRAGQVMGRSGSKTCTGLAEEDATEQLLGRALPYGIRTGDGFPASQPAEAGRGNGRTRECAEREAGTG